MNVRKARFEDHTAIESLCRKAAHADIVLWWWTACLGDETFIVAEEAGRIRGALFAYVNASTVSRIVLAALDDALDIGDWLALSLPPLIAELRRRHVQKLVWFDYGSWAGSHLRTLGFTRPLKIITLLREQRQRPDCPPGTVTVRPATHDDVSAMAAVEQAAFTSDWRYDADVLFHKVFVIPHILVACRGDEVIGYVEGDLPSPQQGHINRLAVLPTYQHRGVGATLLCRILTAFWEEDGVRTVTINTQSYNQRALRLYHRFGFRPTGDYTLAWELTL